MRMKKLICVCGGSLSVTASASVDGVAQVRMRSCNVCKMNWYSIEQPFVNQKEQKAMFLKIIRDKNAFLVKRKELQNSVGAT